MSSEATCPITLSVAGDPRLARLVRMTAANVGAVLYVRRSHRGYPHGCRGSLHLWVHRVDCDDITINFDVDESHVGMTFTFGEQATVDEDDQAAVYAELILASVCDSYEKTAAPLTLSLDLKADI